MNVQKYQPPFLLSHLSPLSLFPFLTFSPSSPSPLLPSAPLPSFPPSLPALPQGLHVKSSQGAPQSWRYGVPHCSVVVGEVEVHRSLRREWSLPLVQLTPYTTPLHTTAHHCTPHITELTSQVVHLYVRMYKCASWYLRTSARYIRRHCTQHPAS